MPATAKKQSTHKDHRSHPYPKETNTADMTSPTSPTSPRSASRPWNQEDDTQLLQARKLGMNWEPIAKQYFPSKTANACRKRHERLIEKRLNAEDWDHSKIEAMASAYIRHRERIWKIVADEVGEKWQVVEAKCMEQGLKNLTQAGRSANRHRTASVNINQDDNNDSGFADESFHADHPYSASSVAHSQSPRRTISNASSYAATPLLQYASPPGPATQQQMYQSIQHSSQYSHQQQQSIPSIASLLASTSGPSPSAIATTN